MLPFLKRNTLWQTRSKNRKEIRSNSFVRRKLHLYVLFTLHVLISGAYLPLFLPLWKRGKKIRGYARMLIPLDVLNTVKKQTFSCFRKMFSYIFIFIFSQRNFIAAVLYIICIKHRFMYVVWIKSLMFDFVFLPIFFLIRIIIIE